MIVFTPTQQGEIRRFADLLGVDALAASDASFNFEFERLGHLTIQPGDSDRAIVSLARRVSFPTPVVLERALRTSGIDPTDGSMLHAGLSDDGDLILSCDLPATGLSVSDLDGALSKLAHAFEGIA